MSTPNLNAGDWFTLKAGNDWGAVYLSREPQSEHGTCSSRRKYRLDEGESIRVRLLDGTERDGTVALRSSLASVSDHGRSYSFTNRVPFVQFSDGTSVDLTKAEIEYDPERDPTPGLTW